MATATYAELGNSGNRQWFAVAPVGSSLYAAVRGTGLYEINTSNGTETWKRNETEVNYSGMCEYSGTLAVAAYNNYVRGFSTSSFTTVVYNWAGAYGAAWFGICADGNIAYGIKYNSDTNQIGIFNSSGGVSYASITNRAYTGIVKLGSYLYTVVDGGQIYKIDPSNWSQTVLPNSSSASWRGICTDGSYLYSSVYGGRLYRIDPSNGSCEELQGDSSNRNWQNITYLSGNLYACVVGGKIWKITPPPPPTPPAVPTASPTTSTIWTDTSVTLSCATSGATIKYTTDGTTPSATNGITYSAPFTVSKTTTIKFCAIKDGYVTAGTDVTLTWAPIFTQLASITGSEFQWICIAYYSGLLYGVLYDNAVVKTIDPTLYSINPATGALTLLATLASTPFNMVIGGDKIYMIGNAGKNVREYNLSGTLLNTYVCDPGTELTGLNGITYLNGKVYAFSGTSYPKTYFFEITPGNTTVTNRSYTGTYSQYCNGQTWTDGTYIYYTNNYDVYRVNPETGATTLFGTVANQAIDTKHNTYLNGSLIVRVGFSGSDALGVCNSSENYSLFRLFPNPNNIVIWNMANDGTYIYGSSGTGTAKIYKIRVFLDLGTPSIYNSGSWKTEKSLYVRNNSTWKLANKAFKVKNGLWTRIY